MCFSFFFVFCFVVKQSLSHIQLFVTPWTITHQVPSAYEILQARILEWVAIPFSRGPSRHIKFTILTVCQCPAL